MEIYRFSRWLEKFDASENLFSKLGKSLSYYNHFAIGCSLSTFITSLFAFFGKHGFIHSITSAIHARIRANRIRIDITSCTGAGITTIRVSCTYNHIKKILIQIIIIIIIIIIITVANYLNLLHLLFDL